MSEETRPGETDDEVEHTVTLVITVKCRYDPARFVPTAGDVPRGVCNLVDVACFAEKLRVCRDPDPAYSLDDVTAYTVEGFLADHAEGKLPA
jgi:hypothetical protein